MSDRHESAPLKARFGAFEVDLRSGELIRQGRTIRLPDKPFQVLIALLERPGELVTREELRERLWTQDTFVDFDNNLNAAVSRLREALNDSAQGPRFIETIPRKGYRFVGPPPVWDGVNNVLKTDKRVSGSGWWRWLAIALSALVVVAAIVEILDRPGRGEPQPEPQPEDRAQSTGRSMLAVLPFENLSVEAGQEYIADGLTEELLTQLGGLAPELLGVIARTSVRQYKKTEKTIEEIGAELGVDFVVEGSVRVQGERLRVAAQLIRVSDQTHMWAESYDRPTTNILELQNQIALAVATAILPRLVLPDAEKMAQEQTVDAEAFTEYLEGRYDLAFDEAEPIRQAVEHFESAVAIDPSFAPFWAALAQAYNVAWFGAKTPEEAELISENAQAAALRAIELDPIASEAYVALAFSRLYQHWDPRGAAEALVVPLEGASNSAQAQQLSAAAFSALARHEEALASAAEALVLDPAAPGADTAIGWYYLFAGRSADAEAQCFQVLERSTGDLGSDNRSASECLYQALLRNGKESEAVGVLGRSLIGAGVPEERFEEVDPEDSTAAILELERIRLEQIFAGPEDDPRAPFDAAVAFTRLGELDRAFAGLEMAFERQDSRLLYLGVDPRFEELREDPRFEELRQNIASAE